MEDGKILESFLQRNEDAISAVREKYGRYCAAVATNILESPEDVEEVLSDTWMRAWNSIPPNHPENLKLYLARIARNLSYDRFRMGKRSKRGGGEMMLALEELSACLSSGEQPEDKLEAEELQREVNRFLKTVKRRDREIFLLRYFYVESYEKIGERYGIRPELVRTVLSRTRRKLKDHLKKEGYFG